MFLNKKKTLLQLPHYMVASSESRVVFEPYKPFFFRNPLIFQIKISLTSFLDQSQFIFRFNVAFFLGSFQFHFRAKIPVFNPYLHQARSILVLLPNFISSKLLLFVHQSVLTFLKWPFFFSCTPLGSEFWYNHGPDHGG